MRHNLRYKILAVLAALALHLMAGRPEYTFVSVRADVKPVHVPADLMLVSLPPITVGLQGPKDAVDQLRRQHDKGASVVTATVDLADKAAGTHFVEVSVNARPPFTAVPGDHPMAIVKLEDIVGRYLPIEVVPQGSAGASVRWESTSVTPERALVKGASSAAEQVARVEAVVPARETSSDLEREVSLRAVDTRGVEVRQIQVTPATARVQVKVTYFQHYKVVPVELKTTGTPAPGYRIATVVLTPLTVTVSGTPRALDGVSAVSTQPVDIGGASSPIVQDVQLSVPAGVHAVQDEPARVKIYFSTEAEPAQ